jgi:hypothetical protein
MGDNKEIVRKIEELKNLCESVDMGDLKNELRKDSKALRQLQDLTRSINSLDVGDLKNELEHKKKKP